MYNNLNNYFIGGWVYCIHCKVHYCVGDGHEILQSHLNNVRKYWDEYFKSCSPHLNNVRKYWDEYFKSCSPDKLDKFKKCDKTKKKEKSMSATAKKSKKLKKVTTLINMVIDESSSMGGKASEVISNFNSFVEEQKKETKDNPHMTVVKFNTVSEILYTNKPLNEVPPLQYKPSGMTALLDAIGDSINRTQEHINSESMRAKLKKKRKPNFRVLTVIITDGEENSSRRFRAETIKELVSSKESQGNWTFVYMGANQDAIMSAKTYGIMATNAINFNQQQVGASMSYLSDCTRKYRGGPGGQSVNFFDGNTNVPKT